MATFSPFILLQCSQTQFLPEDDRVSVSKKEYQASIDVSMGGRIAEEFSMFYG